MTGYTYKFRKAVNAPEDAIKIDRSGYNEEDFRGGYVYDVYYEDAFRATVSTHEAMQRFHAQEDRGEAWMPEQNQVEMPGVDYQWRGQAPNYALADAEIVEAKSSFMEAGYDDQGNADHYKSYLKGLGVDLEWLETNQLEPFWRANPKAFYHAIMLLASRYTSRLGQKDDELQEKTKYLWYVKFATAYAKNGYRPIRTTDVDAILAGTYVEQVA